MIIFFTELSKLLAGCRFSVAPNEEFSYTTLTFVITECNRQLQCLRLMTAATFNSSGQLANATIVYNETHQHHDVVSPSCHITSLEVYRGRDQVIRISHDGFSLSDNGTVEASIKPINPCD